MFNLALSNQDPIEWVFVMIGEMIGLQCMVELNRQYLKQIDCQLLSDKWLRLSRDLQST
jgi:hypothetical protein